jgi:hypothetical protein
VVEHGGAGREADSPKHAVVVAHAERK